MRTPAALVCLAFCLATLPAPAQQSAPPPTAQPGAYGQPPPYYQPYPYGYPPGAYPQYPPAPPQQYRLPDRMPYKDGKPIPVGYHVEDVPIKGLVTAGWITTAIPYSIGLFAAVSADFENQSGWLAVPFVGPWLMMGKRNYGCDEGSSDNPEESAECVADVFVVMGLIMDGVIQAAGGSLLLAGYVATKQELVRDEEEAVRVTPMRIGTGYGLGVNAQF